MRLHGFAGGSVQVRSPNVNYERTVNLATESRDAGTPKVGAADYWTPCVRPFAALGSGPVRALFFQAGRCFAVGGGGFYEILQNRAVVVRGTVAADSRRAWISSNGTNGNQLFIVSGGQGYIFNLIDNTLTQITDDGFPLPAAMGVFIDTYFLVLKGGSNQFNWSAILDGTAWNALDFAQTSLSSDPKRAIGVSHRSVFVFGEKYTEVWVNQPSGGITFAPIPGTFIEHGIDAPDSIVNLDNTLYWVGRDEGGNGVVWRLNGYTPERVSTHTVEYQLSFARPLSDAIAFAYQEQGHGYYFLYVPTLKTSWVYDVTTNEWHERALWNPVTMMYEPDVARCHCFAWGKYHLVGDRGSRAVYHQSLDYLYDEIVVPRT